MLGQRGSLFEPLPAAERCAVAEEPKTLDPVMEPLAIELDRVVHLGDQPGRRIEAMADNPSRDKTFGQPEVRNSGVGIAVDDPPDEPPDFGVGRVARLPIQSGVKLLHPRLVPVPGLLLSRGQSTDLDGALAVAGPLNNPLGLAVDEPPAAAALVVQLLGDETEGAGVVEQVPRLTPRGILVPLVHARSVLFE